MTANPTWGGYPLACDWFDVARRKAVNMIGMEGSDGTAVHVWPQHDLGRV